MEFLDHIISGRATSVRPMDYPSLRELARFL
jgi:hypothetical protein